MRLTAEEHKKEESLRRGQINVRTFVWPEGIHELDTAIRVLSGCYQGCANQGAIRVCISMPERRTTECKGMQGTKS